MLYCGRLRILCIFPSFVRAVCMFPLALPGHLGHCDQDHATAVAQGVPAKSVSALDPGLRNAQHGICTGQQYIYIYVCVF